MWGRFIFYRPKSKGLKSMRLSQSGFSSCCTECLPLHSPAPADVLISLFSTGEAITLLKGDILEFESLQNKILLNIQSLLSQAGWASSKIVEMSELPFWASQMPELPQPGVPRSPGLIGEWEWAWTLSRELEGSWMKLDQPLHITAEKAETSNS